MTSGRRTILAKTFHRTMFIVAAASIAGCARNTDQDAVAKRAAAERVAMDTTRRAWNHDVGVDSVRTRGDTSVVWVSPRNWMATDAPQAGVRVNAQGKIVAIQWILGG